MDEIYIDIDERGRVKSIERDERLPRETITEVKRLLPQPIAEEIEANNTAPSGSKMCGNFRGTIPL